MQRLLQDHALRRRVIAAGRRRVRSDFDNRALIRRLGDIFRQQVPELARGDAAAAATPAPGA
jgi:hypothetical protein